MNKPLTSSIARSYVEGYAKQVPTTTDKLVGNVDGGFSGIVGDLVFEYEAGARVLSARGPIMLDAEGFTSRPDLLAAFQEEAKHAADLKGAFFEVRRVSELDRDQLGIPSFFLTKQVSSGEKSKEAQTNELAEFSDTVYVWRTTRVIDILDKATRAFLAKQKK